MGAKNSWSGLVFAVQEESAFRQELQQQRHTGFKKRSHTSSLIRTPILCREEKSVTRLNPIPEIVPGDDEPECNPSNNPSFDNVLRARLSRRQMLGGTAGAACLAMLGGLKIEPASAASSSLKLGFSAVPKNLADTVTLPTRYKYDVLYALGDPIAAGIAAYKNDGTDDAASFAHRSGDHHDAIEYFGLGPNGEPDPSSSSRGLLCINHEAITPAYLHPTGPTIVGGMRTVPEEVLREFYAHGVAVIEVVKRTSWLTHRSSRWGYDQASPFNRRIHTLT